LRVITEILFQRFTQKIIISKHHIAELVRKKSLYAIFWIWWPQIQKILLYQVVS